MEDKCEGLAVTIAVPFNPNGRIWFADAVVERGHGMTPNHNAKRNAWRNIWNGITERLGWTIEPPHGFERSLSEAGFQVVVTETYLPDAQPSEAKD